ncbi:MAG: hypothetical protein IH914_10870, partial [candidate division Zixibacteria bacterium]|nr:hypothetical protein [candidate division Zixibacteria bacterium]
MRFIKTFALSVSALMLMSAFAFGQGNPCNPCNPCGGKKMKNPCNPCNPCGMGTHFTINDPRNTARFTSEAPLEAFGG